MNCCPICLENNENNIIRLACNHTMHQTCFLQFIKHNVLCNVPINHCPICNKFISVNYTQNIKISFIDTKSIILTFLIISQIFTYFTK